ncbi:hypothetical protein AAGS61_15450 [Lysinibacillus sp. KU-BSD001]|uniref:hypothetical protein n=1 Tax=Lysinibacillus sp. KU-BSD001 TaxID=3141328 RepID=UPI0036EA7C0C
MKQIVEQLERFFQQMEDKPKQPNASAYKYVVQMDPTVNAFDIYLHFLDSEGKELEGDGVTSISVIENGYEDDVSRPDFKEAILDVFKQLKDDGHGHFTEPTYISFPDDSEIYHIQ